MDETTLDTIPTLAPEHAVKTVGAGRYELLNYLGGSDLGRVYRAWDHQARHIVTVKILDERFSGDQAAQESFEHQLSLAASLPEHPHIASISEIGREGRLPYIVMEYVDGQNLKAVLANEGPMPVDRAFRVARQVAAGLDFAHQYGLSHGSVKPQNVLLSGRDHIKLTDFGMVRTHPLSEQSHQAMDMLRAQYLSPELAEGKPVTRASDIYQLGVLLFEMLTGQLPFGASTPRALADKHMEQKPPSPRLVKPEVSTQAEGIVLHALAKDPEKRFRSAGAFAAALQERLMIEKGDTVQAFTLPETLSRPREQDIERTAEHSHPATRSDSEPAEPRHHAPQPQPQRARALERPRQAPVAKRRRFSFASLLFLLVLAIAGAGGVWAYRTLNKAINGRSVAPVAKKHVIPPTKRAAGRTRGAGATNQGFVPGCNNNRVGSVLLSDIYAEETQVVAGRPVVIRFTVTNQSGECRGVSLGVTAFSDSQAAAPIADHAGEHPLSVPPGTHIVKRQFTFPASAAGQTFDVQWTLADPRHTKTYGIERRNHLISVSAR